MATNDKSMLGAAIATALALYAIGANRRQRRLAPARQAGNGAYGRHADKPHQITIAGWWDILKRVFADISSDNVSLLAAGIAFYALLSLTPAFAALIALYGLIFDPSQVQGQVASMESMVPAEARKLIAEQLTNITQGSSSKLGIGLLVSLTIAMWSAKSATTALMSALNIVYAEEEKRNMLTYYAEALGITFGLVLFAIISLVLVAVIPAVVGLLPFGEFGQTVVAWLRWPVLILLSTIGLAFIYRYAVCRKEPRWEWVSWGAVAATLLWIAGSALFSIYVGQFASYNKTYGSLGAVVVLLMWFWLSSFAVLLGGELNAEMERQTVRDTTDRPAKPLGRRGAYAADTVAPHG